ncbi:universal stress protein [Chitinivibrio alkaliphilus]|uniref:Universal stress protein n=1 Tax=Chitinivibrio alkaliphilus ACht1 TaxID=1313304 RepID=U7DA92_9BACT|nr:universal stress protein [Chitinivibrio alkaliphilus]ERP38942.1 UspA domain-containing protein [Chitinivibrio alkaliphilus ACht1]
MKIVLPVDMSEVTDFVVQESISVLKAMGGSVELVHVLQSIPEALIFDESLSVLPYTYGMEEIEADRKKLLARIKERFLREEIPCDIVLLDGDPADEILTYISQSNCDWVVMGSHGHGALYHLVLGSVSEKVIDKACCPVLVVKKQKK